MTQHTRNLSAYFIGTGDKTVEITTWNAADRTAEGIGPCSTVAELKKAYGPRLKPSPYNTHNGIVFAWTVGKHLAFTTEPVPEGRHPTIVRSVGLYSNPLSWASFNASNDGPCARATNTSAVQRPARIPVVVSPALPTALVSRSFKPRVSVRVPKGWALGHDTPDSFSVTSPNGSSLEFVLDPLASTPSGGPLHAVSTTPRGLTTWLQKNPGLALTAPQTVLMGTPLLTATSLDVRLSKAGPAGGVTYFITPGGGLRSTRGRPVRLYLTPVRIATLAHTFAIVYESPSQEAFRATLAATAAIVKNLKIGAAAAANLSALSGFCSVPFNGTCLGEVSAGTHSTSSMRPALTYTVPVGWTNSGDLPGFFGLIPPGGDYTGVDGGQSDYINVATSITTGNGRCGDGHGTARTPGRIPALAAAAARVCALRSEAGDDRRTLRGGGRPHHAQELQAALPLVAGAARATGVDRAGHRRRISSTTPSDRPRRGGWSCVSTCSTTSTARWGSRSTTSEAIRDSPPIAPS